MWWLLLIVAPVLGFILWDIIWSALNRSAADFWFGVFSLVFALVCIAIIFAALHLAFTRPH
jgi:hypothetical protein